MARANQDRKQKATQNFVFLALFGILFLSALGFVVAFAMFKLPHISVHGWIAMALGTVLSMLVGCGLMALAFYSSRKGFDEGADPYHERKRRAAEHSNLSD